MTEGYVSNALRGDQSYGNLATLDNYHGGGLYNNKNDNPSIEDYENIFGPAARDIKEDSDRHRRRQRWHLPDALKGPNPWLADRIDGLITDTTNSPFTTYLLPYKHIDNVDGKIQWNVWSFDEGMASRVPYESSARVLTQTKRSFAGYTVRQGLAIVMEANFMMSEAGQKNFRDQLSQVVHSIQYSNNFDVTMALIQAPSYEKHFEEKYPADHNKPPLQKIRDYVDMFGFMQKNPNALDICIEDCKTTLRSWGSKEPDFLLCNSKLTMQLQMHPERTQYFTQGDDGVRRLREGPNINKYRGLKIINTHSFSTETGVRPRDLLARRVRVGEYYRFVPPKGQSIFDCFGSLYNEERDTWDTIDFRLQYEICRRKKERESRLGQGFTDDAEGKFPKLHKFLKDYGRAVFGEQIATLKDTIGVYYPFTSTTTVPDSTLERHPGIFLTYLFRYILFERDDADKKWKTLSIKEDYLEKLNYVIDAINNLIEKMVGSVLNHDLDATTVTTKMTTLYKGMIKEIEDNNKANSIKISINKPPIPELAKDEIFKHLLQNSGFNVSLDGSRNSLNWYFYWTTLASLFNRFHEQVARKSAYESHDKFKEFIDLLIQDVKMNFNVIIDDIPFYYQPHEILLLRPNIEHQMFGIILGKSGMDDLGATLWGQTQLECYSDSVHGIWGMSYKYNERAIVFNEKNLVRVWDIAYAAYCGGKGTKILQSHDHEVQKFIDNTNDNSKPYNGADIIFIPINMLLNPFKQNFPSPAKFRSVNEETDQNQESILPESNFDIGRHIENMTFNLVDDYEWVNKCIETVSSQTRSNKSLQENCSENSTSCTGGVYFEGSSKLRSKEGTVYTEVQGSGHHGPDFVGAASKRNGKGMKTSFAGDSLGVFAAT